MLGKLSYYVTKASILLVMLALIVGMAGCTGDGYTPSQNLEIRTWYDLDDVRNNLRGHHTLMNDLDSTTPGYTELADQTANGGKGWRPIGNLTGANFTGTFDGQGYEICDLFINRPDETYVGLFCVVYAGGVIKDLGVTNVTMICRGFSGGLAGTIYHCTISNSYSSGNVTGSAGVGGLVGTNFGTVNNCYATDNITGGIYVGGLIGVNMGTVSKCYSTGNVNGTTCVGGLLGQNGLVDESNNRYTGTVGDSYSTASVTGNSSVGGLVGYDYDGTVSISFWDMETSGQATSAGGTGMNTTQMKDIATFSGAAWNIIAVGSPGTRNPAYIWNIVNGVTYPFLSWQPI
jgi:The GLUG motif